MSSAIDIKKNLNVFVKTIVYGFIGVSLYYVTPFFTGFLIDNIVANGKTNLISLWIGCTVIFSILLHAYMFYFLKYIWDKYGLILSNNLRTKLLRKLTKIPNYSYQKFDQSYIFNLFTTDSSVIGSVTLTYIASSILAILRIISCIMILGFINMRLTLISILFIPIYVAAMMFNRKRLQDASLLERDKLDSFIGNIKRLIINKVHINLFKKEVFFENFFTKKMEEWANKKLIYLFWYNLTKEIPSLITTVAPLIVLAYGGVLVINGNMTLGKLIMFSQYTNMIFEPLNILAQAIVEKKSSTPIFKRIAQFINSSDAEKNINTKSLTKKMISIRNYTLYNEQGEILFEVPYLDINKTGLYIIVGDNGTGKTSFLNVLTSVNCPDLFKPNTDKSYCHLDNNFENNFSYLFQPGFLFEGTIQDNITFDEPNNTRDFNEIINVLGIKNIGKKLSFAPLNLSLGEQQKLQLARIFYQQNPIMLLDEPFSNLDVDTCSKLLDYITSKKDKKLFLIISHNQSLQKMADVLLELKNKRIYMHNLKEDEVDEQIV